MKHLLDYSDNIPVRVAPYAGAWIETIVVNGIVAVVLTVAPYAGAWIETIHVKGTDAVVLSLPTRERGLKLCGL